MFSTISLKASIAISVFKVNDIRQEIIKYMITPFRGIQIIIGKLEKKISDNYRINHIGIQDCRKSNAMNHKALDPHLHASSQ